MRHNDTAQSRWQKLDAKRQGLLTRCERYAALTLPSVCPEDGYDEGTDELSQSLNSIGAQAVNSLTNKMMLAMFAPSRPFMKFDLPVGEKNKILKALDLDDAALPILAICSVVRSSAGTALAAKMFMVGFRYG